MRADTKDRLTAFGVWLVIILVMFAGYVAFLEIASPPQQHGQERNAQPDSGNRVRSPSTLQRKTASDQQPGQSGNGDSERRLTDWIQAGSAALIVALTWAILVVYRRQTRLMAMQARIQNRSLVVAAKAAEAAKKSADIAQTALTDTDRPWIFTQEVIIANRNRERHPYIPNNFMFSVKLKNVGRSPAFPQRCVVKFGDAETLPQQPDYSGGINIGLRTTMAAGDQQETNPVGPVARPLKEGEQAPQKIAFGVVTYTDVHKRRHRTGFAFMIAPMGAMALAWNNPNYEYYE